VHRPAASVPVSRQDGAEASVAGNRREPSQRRAEQNQDRPGPAASSRTARSALHRSQLRNHSPLLREPIPLPHAATHTCTAISIRMSFALPSAKTPRSFTNASAASSSIRRIARSGRARDSRSRCACSQLDGVGFRCKSDAHRPNSVENDPYATLNGCTQGTIVLYDPEAMCRAALLGLGVTLIAVPHALPHLEKRRARAIGAAMVRQRRANLGLLRHAHAAAGQDARICRLRCRGFPAG
jgi:hypothetical protein